MLSGKADKAAIESSFILTVEASHAKIRRGYTGIRLEKKYLGHGSAREGTSSDRIPHIGNHAFIHCDDSQKRLVEDDP
jgi:hypothetical protein